MGASGATLVALLLLVADPPPADLVIRGGTVVDGTGAPARKADVAIRGDRIVAVGEWSHPARRTIDAAGKMVAPGFIDLHTHCDDPIRTERGRFNRNYLAQGVTTVITGNCGGGPLDARAYLAELARGGIGTNVAHLVPHGSLRRAVLGTSDRPADAKALERMSNLLDRDLEAGAWGMSSGLIYVPSRYGDADELIALSKIVAARGGLYASHIRDESDGLFGALDEAIRIGRESGARVQVSHLKVSGRDNWGKAGAACDRIEAARREGVSIFADQYPYVASSTRLSAMVVPHWARQGDAAEFARLADDPKRGPELRQAIAEGLETRDGGARIRIARYGPRPDWSGKDLVTLAEAEGTTPLELVLQIGRGGDAQAISFGMSEADVRAIMARDWVATASDGSSHVPGGSDKPHPRAYGTFPRKLRYALDDKIVTLEAAIRSMSALPAKILGLPERGTLRSGAYADVVVFDPGTFRDAATFDDPTRYPTGLEVVLVNGVTAIERGEFREALAGRALRPGADGPADLIIHAQGGWTGDPDRPRAGSVAIRGGALVAVGDRNDLADWAGSRTKIIDRPDAFLLPGLIDAHAHIIMLGESLEQVDLRGSASLDEVKTRLRARIAATPGDGWILGRNWDQSLWAGMAFPTASVLDEVAPDRPVWLRRVDGHAGWANSEALKRAGVSRETQPPSDGEIIRDEAGVPTGVLVDGAMGLVARHVPGTDAASLRRQILAAQRAILAEGLTGVHDASLGRDEAEAFRALDRDGQLKLRVYGMASPPDGGEVEQVSKPPLPAGDRFVLRAMKLFADGAMGSRGALLFAPYSDDPTNDGLVLCPRDTIAAATEQALKTGWQVCVHAIGDKANSDVLSAFEQARSKVPGASDPRLRIEHAQVVRREDVARFAKAGVIASIQPAHAGSDQRWADARLGPDRVLGAYAWRWFADENVHMAFGSDFPVEVVDPFWGLFVAVARQDEQGKPAAGWYPEQRLRIDEALHGFTRGAAFASFSEGSVGMLRPGLRADLTIVDRDVCAATPRDLYQTGVLATIIDGEIVHRAEGFDR